jgi:hypothetical protein
MSKGQPLSRYQQGIVNRYYANLDSIAITRLSEAVGELYLCTEQKKADKLWASVEKALDKTAASDASVKAILTSRDVKKLAELVARLSK